MTTRNLWIAFVVLVFVAITSRQMSGIPDFARGFALGLLIVVSTLAIVRTLLQPKVKGSANG